MKKIICYLFGHKWRPYPPGQTHWRKCKICKKRQKLSQYSASRLTWVDKWEDM